MSRNIRVVPQLLTTGSERRARVRANSFAEVSAVEWSEVASPIGWQPPLFDIPMEDRIRPKTHLCHVPMLDGVPMDVIDMSVEVGLIADEMFPKSDAAITCSGSAFCDARSTIQVDCVSIGSAA